MRNTPSSEKASLREMPDGFVKKMEDFYRTRALAALHSLKRVREARIGVTYDPKLSNDLDGVSLALEALGK